MKTQRYPIENGLAVIEIVLKDFHSLFDERDPAPFREKDLDDDAAEYIVGSAKEISAKRLGKIKILLDQKEIEVDQQKMIVSAIHSFFKYEAQMMNRKIKETLKIGVKSLLIGTLFLMSAILASSLLKADPEEIGKLFIKEGLFLIGWVSMWKPINVFLYDWWPLAETLNIYKCLAKVDIEISHSHGYRSNQPLEPDSENQIHV